MSERASGKSRKSSASKASVSKAPSSKAQASKAAVVKTAPKTSAPKASAPKKATKSSPGASTAPARKSKESAARGEAAQAGSVLDAPSLMARVIRLESERDRLQIELDKAETRIRALEEGREQVVNRIDWVIDTLRSLLEDEE